MKEPKYVPLITSAATCNAVTKKGDQCNGLATHGSAYCHFHDPETLKRRKNTALQRQKADKLTEYADTVRKISLSSPSDIVTIVKNTIEDIKAGLLPPSAGTAIAALCKVASGIMANGAARAADAPDPGEFSAMTNEELKNLIDETAKKLEPKC